MSQEILPAKDKANPPDIQIAIVSNLPAGFVTPEIQEACDNAELVISLGNVDLHTLAAKMHPKKPALCVLGGDDRPVSPPPPFRALHGNGLKYKGWRIAGLSGSSQAAVAGSQGMHISDSEAETLFRNMNPADILICHSAPAGLPGSGQITEKDRGLEAIADYIDAALPAYCLYACEDDNEVQAFQWEDEEASTLVIGVGGLYIPPPLKYF